MTPALYRRHGAAAPAPRRPGPARRRLHRRLRRADLRLSAARSAAGRLRRLARAPAGDAAAAGRWPGGRPAELAELRAQAAELGLPVLEAPAARSYPAAPRPCCCPARWRQPEVVRYIYAADILVIPDTVTTLTASPLKLFEYMAAGRPIVLRELPALREILGDAGIYFPARRRRRRWPRRSKRWPRPGAGRAAGHRGGGTRHAVHLRGARPPGADDADARGRRRA